MTCGTDSTPMDGTACVGGPGTDEQHVIIMMTIMILIMMISRMMMIFLMTDDDEDIQVCGMCGILYDSSYPIGAHAFDQA